MTKKTTKKLTVVDPGKTNQLQGVYNKTIQIKLITKMIKC